MFQASSGLTHLFESSLIELFFFSLKDYELKGKIKSSKKYLPILCILKSSPSSKFYVNVQHRSSQKSRDLIICAPCGSDEGNVVCSEFKLDF